MVRLGSWCIARIYDDGDISIVCVRESEAEALTALDKRAARPFPGSYLCVAQYTTDEQTKSEIRAGL